MESVDFLLELQSVLRLEIPEEMLAKLGSMTYEDFLQSLTVLARSGTSSLQ